MATYISNQTGLWSSASTWLTAAAGTLTPTAPAGAAPQSGGGDKFIIRQGHTVTYDVSGIWGDETSTYGVTTLSTNAIVLSAGTLKASRTTGTELTARGTIYIGASGTFDWGSTADPITAVNANITLHYMTQLSALSASQGAAGLYLMGANAENSPQYNNIYINGKYKLRNTTLAVSAASGSTVLNVVSAAGWEIGDRLVVSTELISNRSSTTLGVLSSTIIQSITGNSITISPGLNTAKSAGTCVSNFSSNINIRSYNPAYASFGLYLYLNTANVVDLNNFHMSGIGAGITTPVGWMPYSYTGTRAIAAQTGSVIGNLTINNSFCQIPVFEIKGVTFDNLLGNTQHYGFNFSGKYSEIITLEDCAGYAPNTNGYFSQSNTQASIRYKNCTCHNGSFGILLGSAVPNSIYIESCNLDAGIPLANSLNGLTLNVINSKLRGTTAISTLDAIQKGVIKNSNIYHNSATGAILQNNVNASGSLNYSNCNFYGTTAALLSSITKTSAGMLNKTAQTAEFSIFQPNSNLFDYRRLNYYHYSQSDLTMRKRGITSYRIKPEVANTQFFNYFTIPATIDTPQRIKGSLRFDSNYGVAFPPSISFVGAGVSVLCACSAAADVWQDFDVTLNPTTTDDITLSITCQSSGTNGYVWLDGMQIFPYIQTARHYGFEFDNNIYRTINVHNTLSSESDVAALTSITTADYLYDAATYWSVVNPALTSYIDLIDFDGNTLDFNNKNIVVDALASTAFAYNSTNNTITINSSTLSGGIKFDTIQSQGSLSAINDAQIARDVLIRTSNYDSELVYSGADDIILYPTLLDAQNSTNPGPSANNGVFRFLYGQTTQGVVLSGTTYIKWTAGTYTDLYTGTIYQGRNELGDLSNQAGIAIAINNMNIINQGVQNASKLIPHATNTSTPTGLTVQIQTLINDQQIVNEGVKKASILVPHTTNLP